MVDQMAQLKLIHMRPVQRRANIGIPVIMVVLVEVVLDRAKVQEQEDLEIPCKGVLEEHILVIEVLVLIPSLVMPLAVVEVLEDMVEMDYDILAPIQHSIYDLDKVVMD